ncbi:hypothetical protein EYR40_001671 [Pleurotus pulmonarius]|nr:hypothetical protein EYR40_001671 [Pleurotus pulmonarius]
MASKGSSRRAKRKAQSVCVEMDMEDLLSSSVFHVNASTTHTSADGRRVYHHTIPVLPPSPRKRSRADEDHGMESPSQGDGGTSMLHINEALWRDMGVPADTNIGTVVSKPPAKRYISSDEPLKEWQSSVSQEYLMEMIALEGPGTSSRLKRRIVSSVEKDPGLGVDWGYFVETEPFPISERDVQQASFEIFSEQQGARVNVWKQMVMDFEEDGARQNPYEVPCTGFSENDVRLQFAQEEAEAAARGVLALHEVTTSGFISEALDLEEQQLRARALIAEKTAGTSAQMADITDLRTKLTRSLARIRALQGVYLPTAIPLLLKRVVPKGEGVECVPILFPSSFSETERAHVDKRVVDVEGRLREAKCRSALDEIRNLLFIKSRLVSYKDRNVRHQAANTRTRTLIQRNESKIKLQVKKFQSSWTALKSLANGDESKLKWPALRQEHIRCMEDPDTTSTREVRRPRSSETGREDYLDRPLPSEGHGGGEENGEPPVERVLPREGYRTMSWIWMEAVESTGSASRGMNEGEWTNGEVYNISNTTFEPVLRSEFAKSWARVRRWTEEVALLKEEMRRTIVTLRHRARKWEERATTLQLPPTPYSIGLSSYAHSQADLLYSLANKYEAGWTDGRTISNGFGQQDEEDESILDADIREARAEAEEEEEEEVEAAAEGA